jgi:hypothetical protein
MIIIEPLNYLFLYQKKKTKPIVNINNIQSEEGGRRKVLYSLQWSLYSDIKQMMCLYILKLK